MPTDLFVIASGIAPDAVARAVPPACRRGVEPAPAAVREDGVAVVTSPVWAPRAGAVHLLPSFSLLSDTDVSFRLEVSVRAAGAWTPWVAGATIGAAVFPPLATSDRALAAEVDVFLAPAPVEAARARVRVAAPGALGAPWMLALSSWDGTRTDARTDARLAPPAGARLAVPARSQMEADPALARRICSPTCVAMVLEYWGRADSLAALAAEIFHPGLDLYGVWPAAIRAASRRGVAGYLLRVPDWAAAAWCLAAGLPLIASVHYAAGELAGAAVAETPGHLLVLTGWDGETAFVNDPAAPCAETVPRRYPLDQLRRVWLGRGGVAYVLFHPAWATMRRDG